MIDRRHPSLCDPAEKLHGTLAFHEATKMKLWTLLPEGPLSEDRAYLLGYLQSVFDSVETTRLSPFASTAAGPTQVPDLVLNLVAIKNRDLLADLEAKATHFGAALSPPASAAWRSQDKRSYLEDYADVSPPTRVARSIEEVRDALETFGGPIVIKDPLGGGGRAVERISSFNDLPLAEGFLENTLDGRRELIVQPFLDGFAKGDKRVLVQRRPDGSYTILGQIFRVPPPGGWKSNVRGGGRVLMAELTDQERELALQIAPRTDLDNIALDLGEHDGRVYFIEHNLAYGGIIDFDLGTRVRQVERSAALLVHLARWGRQYASSCGTETADASQVSA